MSSILDVDGFTIIKRIGTGARTTIYLATDESTRQTVALKRAVLERPEDTRIFEQMETEFKVARQISHPYIRKCYRIIRQRKLLKTTELLLSMEMFNGRSLEESRGLSLGDILLLFRMIATGLNAMHEAGFVHCDIKPNNILVSSEGALKIIDLGQSCKLGAIKSRIQGTPDYIAPEQVLRKHISHRTDIFNLGATMYWALTGKNVPTLIPKKTNIGMAMHVVGEFKAPHEIYRKIPEPVSQIVMDCVQEKPADRPANMGEVIARLDTMIRSIFGSRIGGNGKARND
ncbi:MAG TPA: serine/threonine-protein kinase [Anaerohalosphaeraceae bacterium]|jgi:serine/threonine protein kinase|nr:serine/threonine-protein kinase [Anaerohalosphaeraceae bacterium]HRT50796.1 serine/threonine-protein kinase [Anaerohalosphaeraceae bacterium]HRT86832.1 serine/threonine-protein kinase [Anaerohalosphaeraceae bacterium]